MLAQQKPRVVKAQAFREDAVKAGPVKRAIEGGSRVPARALAIR
jgi:hypothetical protein